MNQVFGKLLMKKRNLIQKQNAKKRISELNLTFHFIYIKEFDNLVMTIL